MITFNAIIQAINDGKSIAEYEGCRIIEIDGKPQKINDDIIEMIIKELKNDKQK